MAESKEQKSKGFTDEERAAMNPRAHELKAAARRGRRAAKAMWPTAFALTELTAADQSRIAALVKQAVS